MFLEQCQDSGEVVPFLARIETGPRDEGEV